MTSFTQLIDVEGNFIPTMELWLRDHEFETKGFSYSVVTVLGCQSSGKSTLLNELFGTEFEVMDASKGRRQTTKGLWLSCDRQNHTIIIDTEGTDSKERGEDRLTFEHRAALFSLALADVVIVNMWYHDLGRYTASNYGLLKTVLGVNLELFQQQQQQDIQKTTMLFVIRDYSESQTPIEKLNEMIQLDIRNIWKETTKPEHLRDLSADDFFVFLTVGLPSRIGDVELFSTKCNELREMWIEDLMPSSYSRQIPADGFAVYCKSVWETILKSAELDIPSQKEMLATFRCEELKNVAIAEVLPAISAYLEKARKSTLSTKSLDWGNNLVEKALDVYDQPASRYHESIFLKKRDALIFQLQLELQKVVDVLLSDLRHRIATEAISGLDLLLCPTGANMVGGVPQLECWAKFPQVTDRWRSQTVNKFDESAISLTVSYKAAAAAAQQPAAAATTEIKKQTTICSMDFDSTYARQALLECLDSALLRAREKQQGDFVKVVGNLASDSLGDFSVFLTAKDLSVENFWNRINDTFTTAKEEVMAALGQSWLGLQVGENAHQDCWDEFASAEVLRRLRYKLEQLCDWLQNHIYNRFQEFFSQDDEGVPRQWPDLTSEKIKEIYVKAMTNGLLIVTIMESVKLNLDAQFFEKHQSLKKEILLTPLLTPLKREHVVAKANRQMRRACQEALLMQSTGGRAAHIPWWIWCLLLAFGYNEISLVVFNPFALIVLLIVAGIALITYRTKSTKYPVHLARYCLAISTSTLISALETLQSSTTVTTTSGGSQSTRRDAAAAAAAATPIQPKIEIKEESNQTDTDDTK